MVFSNLFVGYFKEADFRVLVCAFDKDEAGELLLEYRDEANIEGSFEVQDADIEVLGKFDCDYVIA